MTTSSIVMMALSLGVMWGGLAWAILRLRKHPDVSDFSDEE